MPKPFTQNNYDRLSSQVMLSTKHIADKSMLDAAVELRETQNTDKGVSIDRTWQKEGFVPLTVWLLLFRSTHEKYWNNVEMLQIFPYDAIS